MASAVTMFCSPRHSSSTAARLIPLSSGWGTPSIPLSARKNSRRNATEEWRDVQMKFRTASVSLAAAALMALTSLSVPAVAQQKFVTVGTGGVSGGDYGRGGGDRRRMQ